MGAEQYPYDPALRVENFDGLDKLRCVADRDTAAMLYKLWFQCEPDKPKPPPARVQEIHDASEYEDQNLHEPAGSARDAADRADACISEAWKVFYKNMAEYENLHGRTLSPRQRADHEYKFGGIMLKTYGRTHTRESWEVRKRLWDERTQPRSAQRGSDE